MFWILIICHHYIEYRHKENKIFDLDVHSIIRTIIAPIYWKSTSYEKTCMKHFQDTGLFNEDCSQSQDLNLCLYSDL